MPKTVVTMLQSNQGLDNGEEGKVLSSFKDNDTGLALPAKNVLNMKSIDAIAPV